jgi:hypothetical protein
MSADARCGAPARVADERGRSLNRPRVCLVCARLCVGTTNLPTWVPSLMCVLDPARFSGGAPRSETSDAKRAFIFTGVGRTAPQAPSDFCVSSFAEVVASLSSLSTSVSPALTKKNTPVPDREALYPRRYLAVSIPVLIDQ